MAQLPRTHLFEIMRVLIAKCSATAREPPNMQPGRPFYLTVEVGSYINGCAGIEGTITDPFDGQKYRLTLEVIREGR